MLCAYYFILYPWSIINDPFFVQKIFGMFKVLAHLCKININEHQLNGVHRVNMAERWLWYDQNIWQINKVIDNNHSPRLAIGWNSCN